MIEEKIKTIEEMRSIIEDDNLFLSYLDNILRDIENDINRLHILEQYVLSRINSIVEIEDKNKEKDHEEEGQKILELMKIPQSAEIPQNAESGEETIDSIIFDFEEKYKKPFPPKPLIDKEKNKKLLDLGIDEPLFYYLRTITHPYKPEISDYDKDFLNYLVDIEGWDKELVSYLVSDLNLEWSYEGFVDREYDPIDYIENYIDLIADFIKENPERIKCILTEAKMSIEIKRKKTLFRNNVSIKYFRNYMNLWGSVHIAIKKKTKNN